MLFLPITLMKHNINNVGCVSARMHCSCENRLLYISDGGKVDKSLKLSLTALFFQHNRTGSNFCSKNIQDCNQV